MTSNQAPAALLLPCARLVLCFTATPALRMRRTSSSAFLRPADRRSCFRMRALAAASGSTSACVQSVKPHSQSLFVRSLCSTRNGKTCLGRATTTLESSSFEHTPWSHCMLSFADLAKLGAPVLVLPNVSGKQGAIRNPESAAHIYSSGSSPVCKADEELQNRP